MLDDRHYMRQPRFSNAWSMTTLLIVANFVAFIVQWYFISPRFTSAYLALSTYGVKHGLLYQFLTFQFLHGGWMHLLFNCLGIYMFGRIVEDRLGTKNFLILYFLGGVIGGLVQVLLGFAFPHYFSGAVVGASAGLFALIAAFAIQSPEETILLFFLPLPAKYILFIQGGAALVGLIAHEQVIAHGAHLGGMLTGIGFIRWLSRPRDAIVRWRPFRRAPKKREFAKVIPLRQPWKPKMVEPDLPPAEFMAQEVDPILDKISAQGIQSLSEREKQILEAARKKMAKK